MSYPEQQPVQYGAVFHSWSCGDVANVFAKPQTAKFAGVIFFVLAIFAKAHLLTMTERQSDE